MGRKDEETTVREGWIEEKLGGKVEWRMEEKQGEGREREDEGKTGRGGRKSELKKDKA